MDNNTNLELEILITLSQNRKIASSEFSQLFEDQWNRYDAKFRELSPCGLFEEVISSGVKVYSLTDKGKIRITDLIDQRESQLLRLAPEKKKKTPAFRRRKFILDMRNSVNQFRMRMQKATAGSQIEVSR